MCGDLWIFTENQQPEVKPHDRTSDHEAFSMLQFLSMEETIFSKIIRREIPAMIVYEDEYTMAFLDACPVNPGHTLVVPKKYFKNLYDIDDETLSHVARTVQKVAIAVKHAMQADGINIHQNNDPVAGQVIFHTHTHVIPRFKDDGIIHWHGKGEYHQGEKAIEIGNKIKSTIV